MDAIDLMLGDWVICHGEPYRINQIYDLLCMENEEKSWLAFPEEVSPIPLTPEILEKNGFRWDGSGQQEMMFMTPYDYKGIRLHLYVGLKHKTMNIFSTFPELKSPNWRKHNRVDLEVCGPYVHELQHALRLCGIEKEIAL